MSEWITDRKPKASDAHKGVVWTTRNDYIDSVPWRTVNEGEPWMPITPPKPYVKAKRCIVLLHNDGSGLYRVSIKGVGVPAYNIPTREAAERIAAIYEEVMP